MEEKRRGRPPVAEPGSAVCTWLRQTEHDRLIALARQQGQSVSALVRTAAVSLLNKCDSGGSPR